MQCAFLKTELLFLIREGTMMQRETLVHLYTLCLSWPLTFLSSSADPPCSVGSHIRRTNVRNWRRVMHVASLPVITGFREARG